MGGLLSLSRWLQRLVQGHAGPACASLHRGAACPTSCARPAPGIGPWRKVPSAGEGLVALRGQGGGGGGSDSAAVRKECREGDRGTVLVAARNPPTHVPVLPAGHTELSEGCCWWLQPVTGTGLGRVAGGWWW